MNPARNKTRPTPDRRRFRRAVVVAAVLGAILGITAPAHSYWTAISTGPGVRADAATLQAPGLTATSMTATSATLAWTQPFQPTGYDLAQSPGGLTGCATNPATNATGCTATGLAPNTTYTFSLSAAMYNWRSPATVTAATPKQSTTTTIISTTLQSAPAGTSFTATANVSASSGYGSPPAP
ncbi:fibronectin type III domain-containing protein [Arthrobacter polaris]|uniref:fibronectin type III domain-containing protein n=1 Tax=Arthrobacter polaris TaxID=2813727 RepID=UPI001F4014C2|nr:fibronectin type III domain-containing protein [Arthrobacter polaris]UIK89387.1 fibronectin type III domain-containing protein [Arthrobacter polaris]